MNQDNKLLKRYPGLPPFRKSQSALFCGRETEVSTLYQMLRSERLVVLFGRSGAGKSSLLNAGLFPELERNGFVPLNVRLQSAKDEKASARKIVLDSLAIYKNDKKLPKGYTPNPDLALWETLKCCEFPFENIPVLVFDQFEELFNYSSYQRQLEFLSDLAGIIHAEPPNSVLNWLLAIPIDKRTEEHIAWCRQPETKVLLAIRSDRFYELSQWGSLIPQILRYRFELKPLDANQARKAIEEPAMTPKVSSPPYYPPFTYRTEVLDTIINKLKAGKSYIETTYLQIICSQLEDRIQDPDYTGDRSHISMDDVKIKIELETIIESFYKNQLDKIKDVDKREIAQSLIEDKLIYNGRRRLLAVDEVHAALVPYPELLDTLQDLRLVRGDVREEQVVYEISHDVLLGAINKSKAQREIEAGVFYEKQLENIASEDAREVARKFLEDKLLVGNKRILMPEEQAKSHLQKYSGVLGLLVDYRLIRSIPQNGKKFYEISHDSLIDSMSKSKALREANREREKLQKEFAKKEQRLNKQREELDRKNEEIDQKNKMLSYQILTLELRTKELNDTKQLAEQLEKAEKAASKGRKIYMILAISCALVSATAIFFYFRSRYFLHRQEKAQAESVSFIAGEEYDKGNHDLAFRLYQASGLLTGKDTLQDILKNKLFGILSGQRIELSDNRKWVAISRKDSSLSLYAYRDGKFILQYGPLQKVGDFKFAPNSEALGYVSSRDNNLSLKLIQVQDGKPYLLKDTALANIKMTNEIDESDTASTYSEFSFSPGGNVLYCLGSRSAFFYSLSDHKPLTRLMNKYQSLNKDAAISSSGVTFFDKMVLLESRYATREGFIKRRAIAVRTSDGEIQFDYPDISLVRKDIENRRVYVLDRNRNIWMHHINESKGKLVIKLPDTVSLRSVVNERLLLLEQSKGSFASRSTDLYDMSQKKYLLKDNKKVTILETDKKEKWVAFIGKDSAVHVLNALTMKDTAFSDLINFELISDTKYLKGYDKEGRLKKIINVDSLSHPVFVSINQDAETIIGDNNMGLFFMKNKDGKVIITSLVTKQRVMDFPLPLGFEDLFFIDPRIISIAGRDPYLLLPYGQDFLLKMDSTTNQYDFLENYYPKLTELQKKQYGLK